MTAVKGVAVHKTSVDYRSMGRYPYPEWAVRDIDCPPGDHDCVFNGFPWCVGTGVCAIAVVLDLHI